MKSATFINSQNIPKPMYKKKSVIDIVRGRTNSSSFFPKIKSKKGQITIFIILGILLLLALMLVIFLRKEIVAFGTEIIIPTEKSKFERIITTCIEDTGREALRLVALQGGYIEVPQQISQDSNLHLKTSPFTVVPYWAYGPNTNIPSIDRIKEEIDGYMEENLRGCLFGLPSFTKVYNLIEKSQAEADTVIADNKVIFNVHWNIEIRDKSGETLAELIDHIAESPVKLKKVYQTAEKIIQREMESLKFEDITQDLIALEAPGLPLSGTELSCQKKKWKVNEAKSTMQDMLRINIRKLKVEGTEFVDFPDEFPYYQNHYIWRMGSDFEMEDVSVIFHYDNSFPFIFQVTPSQGNTMSSGMLGGSSLLSAICLQTWKFTYDVVYPVLVRVRDEKNNYDFNIAFTVHLIRNSPNRDSFVAARPSVQLNYATDEIYCREPRVPMTVLTWELIENEEQGIYDRQPLDKVNISFTCLKYRCDMGETEFDFASRGYESGLSLNFPHCVGGILRGTKGGYREDWVRVVTDPGAESELELAPLFNFPAKNIKIIKHEIGDDGQPEKGKEARKRESAMIKIIHRKKDDPVGRPFHESSLVVSEDIESNILEQQNLVFLAEADFTYELKVDLFDDETFVGGYKINWTAPWQEMETAEELIFHVASREKGGEEGTFALLAELEKHSEEVPKPEFE